MLATETGEAGVFGESRIIPGAWAICISQLQFGDRFQLGSKGLPELGEGFTCNSFSSSALLGRKWITIRAAKVPESISRPRPCFLPEGPTRSLSWRQFSEGM